MPNKPQKIAEAQIPTRETGVIYKEEVAVLMSQAVLLARAAKVNINEGRTISAQQLLSDIEELLRKAENLVK